MRHLAEEDMVMHYYGEADEGRRAGAHLAECEECRRTFDDLSKTLRAMTAIDVPERDDSYGAQVWSQIQSGLEVPEARSRRQRASAFFTWPRLATAGALAVLLVAAYVAGRSSAPPAVTREPQRSEAVSASVRERILLVAVGEHLERSRVVLTEISNRNGGEPADISSEQAIASDLVASNRLYRQAAVRSGDPAVAAVLEDLERVLVEIANSPSAASHDDLARLREQIQSEGLLFKVTVMGASVSRRQRETAAAPLAGTKAST
jgi:hypothetical protein